MNTEVFNAQAKLRQAARQLTMAAEALERKYWNDATQYTEAASANVAVVLPELRNIAKYCR